MKILILRMTAIPALLAAVLTANALGQEVAREKQKQLWKKMEAEIQKVDRALEGVMSVALVDPANGEQILINPDEVMPQASAIKIAVLLELYKQGQEGNLKLMDEYVVQQKDLVPDSDIFGGLTPGVTKLTLRDLATIMMAVSDNSATNVLIDRLGMDNINQTLRSLGLKHTQLRRKMLDLKAAKEGKENVATAREMATLLRLILDGKVLKHPIVGDFWTLLRTPKDSHMREAVPAEVVVASKHGWLEGVRTESGVVFVLGRPFILSVMTTYVRDERRAEDAIAEITRIAYRYFDQLARASEYGRVISSK
jgi:beta-lactamase class A